jgi:hypothetical protein
LFLFFCSLGRTDQHAAGLTLIIPFFTNLYCAYFIFVFGKVGHLTKEKGKLKKKRLVKRKKMVSTLFLN